MSPARWLAALKSRNPALYLFGWTCWTGAVACLLMACLTHTLVMGINAWIKPAKFFISVAIAAWTLGWLLHYLDRKRAVRHYTVCTIITLSVELVIITMQAARGRLSHFNVSTLPDYILFQTMGGFILLFTVWTAVIDWRFFKQRDFCISPAYVWGIRLGLLFFILFALEGGVMGYLLRHTVGGPDGGPGLPLVNWSIRHGDLRVAHFLGIHSLQLLPIAGYLLGKRKYYLWTLAALYFIFTAAMLAIAAMGKAFYPG